MSCDVLIIGGRKYDNNQNDLSSRMRCNSEDNDPERWNAVWKMPSVQIPTADNFTFLVINPRGTDIHKPSPGFLGVGRPH